MNPTDRVQIAIGQLRDFNETLQQFSESQVRDEIEQLVASIFSMIEELAP